MWYGNKSSKKKQKKIEKVGGFTWQLTIRVSSPIQRHIEPDFFSDYSPLKDRFQIVVWTADGFNESLEQPISWKHNLL